MEDKSQELYEKIIQSQDLRLAIAGNMKIYGGSFVQALAECLLRADQFNTRRIVNAFTEYVEAYLPEQWVKK